VSKSLLPSFGVALLLAAGPLLAQAPSFEVASVKPSEPITPAMLASGKLHAGMKIDGKRVDIGNFGLMQLICKAYDVKAYQVTGPSWLKTVGLAGQRFDIIANLPEGATKEQVPQMLQALLAERFKLVVHRETKDQAVYALVVGRGRLMIEESQPPAASPDGAAPNPAVTGSSSVSISQTKGGAVVSDGAGKQHKMTPSPDGKSMRFEIWGATLAELAEGLSPMVDHPIVDKTGLTGKYHVTLDISMQELLSIARAAGAAVPAGEGGGDASKPAELASDPGGSSLFTSIQTLGLKLEPRKSPMPFIVVDSVEKMPTEN
jgi:uncharacterized protein (TIGR03435 family)